jgi:hypothetical protein
MPPEIVVGRRIAMTNESFRALWSDPRNATIAQPRNGSELRYKHGKRQCYRVLVTGCCVLRAIRNP